MQIKEMDMKTEAETNINTTIIGFTLSEMYIYLKQHESICLGVSGGSDSNIIVHMIATNFREFLPKIHFVFCNTGLEYRATLKHIEYMENTYNINIERISGVSVVTAVHRDGVPIVSKDYSNTIKYAEKGSEWALYRVARDKKDSKFAYSQKQKDLAQYLIDNKIKVDNSCCEISKKKPFKKYMKDINCDMQISGERKCEGGNAPLHIRVVLKVPKTSII